MKNKFYSQIFVALLGLVSVFYSSKAKAQTIDTTLFDYDINTGCNVCGDAYKLNTFTLDSILDATPGKKFYAWIQVKLKFFSCYSGPLNLYLNGTLVATNNIGYICSCNGCDSTTFNISSLLIAKYYKYGQKNYFKIETINGNSLYMDRTTIYRYKYDRMNYDAGILSVDSPLVSTCAGTKNIKVRVYNNGKKQISSLGVDWLWNGASQSSASLSGTLDTVGGSGSNNALITLGSKTFTKGKIDTLKAWTKNPGGAVDTMTFNDTTSYMFYGSYSDTITVGGTSPMFSTVQAAVNALMTYGVCGPTWVKIRPGTYNEQVLIGAIPGSSSTNTVTFISSTLDSSSVIISYNSSSSYNYTVNLNNTSNIIFYKVTLRSTNTSYSRVVYLSGSVGNIQFQNCYINAAIVTSTSTSRAAVYRSYGSSLETTTNIVFNNSLINGGSFGIYLYNSSSNYLNGFYVRNCIFQNPYYGNIYFVNAKNIDIKNNKLLKSTSSYSYGGYGIYCSNVTDSLNIRENHIIHDPAGYGIYMYYSNGLVTKPLVISNNFISTQNSNDGYSSVYLENSMYVDFVFNNVYTSYDYDSYCLYTYDGGNIRILNNSLHHENTGYVFNIVSTSSNSISKSNRNNFYNEEDELGIWYGNNIAEIGDLKPMGYDTNSVSSNPNYISDSDLHAYNVDLDANAKPYAGITKDIDGQTRNTSTPDIGADEFSLKAHDAGIVDKIKVTPGTKCMKVVLRNFGSSTLTSAKIDWIFNGVSKSQVSWSGSLAKGDTDIVCLGNITFAKDSLYHLVAWSSQPNSVTDSIKTNDTLDIEFYTSLNGIYTIGGSSPDFATFGDAVTALHQGGIIDSAYFKVRNGTYTEQIEINNIDGAKDYNDVVFESENKDSTKVTLEYSPSSYDYNYVVLLNHARGITFRKMKIQNFSTGSYKTVLKFNNHSKNIKIENNIITNFDSTNTSSYNTLVYIEYNYGSNLYFSQNFFNRGSYAIYCYNDWNNNEKNLTIKNNIFKKQSYYGLYIYYISGLNVYNNTFEENQNQFYAGMYIANFAGTNRIYNNKININSNNNPYGMHIRYSYYVDFDTLHIYNNMISVAGNTQGYGMYLYDVNFCNIYYNSILNQCTDSTGNSSACYIDYGYYKVFNNNFIHKKNGYAYYNDYVSNIKSNYNNIYSNGTKYVYWDGDPYATLNSYISASGLDSNSIEVDPSFNSSTDLHTSSVSVNAKAKVISTINKDIDGETRNSSTPDIGADEFTPPALDASLYSFYSPGELFKADSTNFEFIIKNLGLDTIKKITVRVKINNDTLPRKQFIRTFASGDTIHVKMGKKYLLHKDSVYNFTAWTSLPNGSTDQKPSNDTLTRTNCRTALSGVYTIGGTSPDFSTFKTAVAALTQRGIIDSVRFRVRMGTYTEQIRIPQILGASKRNAIIFESQDQDTTKVILTYASTYSDTNYIVYLDGADGVTFRYMTLVSTSSSNYNRIFNIQNGAHYNTIYKNVLEAPNTNWGTDNNALIYSSNSSDNYLLIKDNHIKNGDYAIYLYGTGSPYETNLEISENHILNPYYYGIYVYYGDTVNISKNYIYMDKYYYNYGIYIRYVYNNLIINSNILNLPTGYIPIYLYYCGNSFKRSLVSNNSIYAKNNSTNNYGIHMYYNNYVDFIHNTINIDCYSSSSRDVYAYYGSNNGFYNNILSNNLGYTMYVNSTTIFSNLNYNNYYTGGSNLGYWNGSNVNNLASWKSTTTKDTNSYSVNPKFYSASNLHVKEITLNGTAKYFSKVPLDFDGQTRNTSTPDIGADEFDPPSNDAGISNIIIPKKPFPADSQWVKVVLKNYGANAITSVSINWKFNGTTQTTKSWTGTLNSGDTVHVKLLKKKFVSGTPYSTKAWTTNPNSTTDPENTNDTNEVLNQYPAMSGIYTIGGSTPDFATFTDAVNAMKLGGIIDSVRFDVRTGTYTEQFRIPRIAGATNENSIIFQSEGKDSSLVKLSYTPSSYTNNWVVRIDSAIGVTLRYMRISSGTSSSYNRVISIIGDAQKINIHNCNLKGFNSTSTSDYNAIIFIYYDNSSYPTINNVKIYKNRFTYGAYGVYAYTYSDVGYGKDLKIYENNLENQHYMSIYSSYSRDLYIHKNNVYHTNSYTGYSSGYGMYIYYANAGFTVTSNKVYNMEYMGMYYYNCDGTTGDSGLIANNFVHTRTNNTVYGIYIYSSDYLNVFYNNINLISTNTNSRAFYIEYTYNNRINNNNFIHSGNGYSFYRYSGNFLSNYNNFYTNGSTMFNNSGTNYSNLSAWQGGTGNDMNSINVNPDYKSSTDLHTEKIDLNGKARNIKYLIKYDIDDQKRDSIAPDIGADEYKPAAIDAGVHSLKSPGTLFNAGTHDIIAVVKNYGTDTIKKVYVKVKINNDTLTRKYIVKNIKTGDTIHVKLGQFTFHKDSTYKIITWTFNPNNTTDENLPNDTLTLNGLKTALSGVYTIGGTSPDYTTFKAALYALKTRGIKDSVRFRVRSGTYSEQLTIPNINGAGNRNSIIFESENQDTASVTLQYNSTYSDSNYVVMLNGTNGITFRYLILKALSTSNYTRIFYIRGGAHYNTIYKNILVGKNTSWGSNQNALIYSDADADNYLQIIDNHIKEGDYSIYLYGYPSSSPYIYEKGLEISGNKLLNPFNYGIYLERHDSVNISANYIYMDKYYYSYGIYLYYVVTNYKIHRNIMNLKNGYMGLFLYNCGSSYKTNYVTNNAIYLKNTSTNPYAIYSYYTNYTSFIHNSINLESPYTSYGLYMQYGGYNSLYNNNFVNTTANGYAMYVYSSSNLSSNYNNIYATGTYFNNWNGTNISSLASWKSTTGLDANSISVNPQYKGVNNLHVKAMELNAAATYFSQVPLDFDYETRNTSHPDIGVDEFDLPSNDAGISHIIIPKKPFPSDSQYVKVAMKNYGGNTLYQVNIAWTFNGVAQTPLTWNDTLESGDSIHIKLAKKYFAPYTDYSVKVWTYLPNGTGDSINTNDTLQILNQRPALSGVYTIGGASPDFATFADAVTAMKNGGIIDSVRFDVRNGTYYEQISIPYIYGAENEKSIIFQSEAKDSSKVFLVGATSSSYNYVVQLDSTRGVTFRHMTLTTTMPYYYNRIFDLSENVKNINIHDCNLIGKSTTNTNSEEAVINIRNNNSNMPSYDNIKIYNNNFLNGSNGVFSEGYSNISHGKNLKIYSNNFSNQYYMGVYVYYGKNIYINKNILDHNSTAYSYGYGMRLQYIEEGVTVTENKIINQTYYGLYMVGCNGATGDTSLVANNFIHVGSNNSVYGTYIDACNYFNFLNNNISLTSTNTSSYPAYFNYPSITTVCSNIFSTTGAGYAFYSYYGSFIKCNFNNFYTTGSNLFYRSGTNYSTLSSYISATGYDINSLNVNPDYVSSTDLHVRGTDLDAKGRNHKYIITKDIDGQNRNTTKPDIGADEFDIPAANDAGILTYISPVAPFAAGSKPVKVVIKNFGSDSLKSATIKWKVNGTLQSNKSWTGKLKTGQTDTVNIGSFNFLAGKDHDMVFWTTDPNGHNDTTNYNDTLKKYDVYAALDGVYTIGGTLPDYNTFNDAIYALKTGGVIDSVWFKIRTGSYSVNVQIDQYWGSSPSHPVYFEAATGDSSDVVISRGGATNQIFLINGADYITFRKLTFSDNMYGISITNKSQRIAFENCRFNILNYYYYYSYGYGIYSGSSADDSLTVKNCRFDNGNYAIYLYGYPSSGSILEKDHIITNNAFYNQNVNAISIEYVNSPTIKYNYIVSSVDNSSPSVNINNTQNKLVISYNKIIRHTGANSAGLVVNNHSGNSLNKANIYNNFISTGGNNYSRTVYFNYSSYINLYHNSLNQYGSATGTNSVALQIYGGNNYDVRNNVIPNTGGGYAMIYTGSPSSVTSDYNDLYTSGTYFGNISGTDYTTFSAWKTATSKEANSINYNPNYTTNIDLHSNLAALDSACLPISIVTDDIDGETRNTTNPDIGADEFQSLPVNIGVFAILKPENTCGLDSSFIKLKIFNFGNQPQVNYPVRYLLSGSSTVKSATITDTIKPGQFYEYQFAAKEAVSFNTLYTIKAWTDISTEQYRLNDSTKITFTNYSVPDSVKSMMPVNGTTNVDVPFSLSWLPSNGATKYDIYVWDTASSRPSTPTVSNVTQISYQFSSGFSYGTSYYWQIVAKNPICNTEGKVQMFTMRFLPDLVVNEVNGPHTAFSGTNISLTYKIKNNGLGAANGTWYDNVYLSGDAVWDITDQQLASTTNAAALSPSQTYSNTLSFNLPNGTNGNYYLFVFTDKYNSVGETDNNNNSGRDTGKIKITLTPPPDLQVTSVSRPSVAFSGSNVNMTYTVKNKGTGDTRNGSWYDKIYLSTEKEINGTSYHLATIYRNANLKVDSTYQVFASVTIPNYISGKYFFVVYTDALNYEYENAFESNNTKGSDTIKVLLTPPPDLIVRNVQIVDSTSNSQVINLKYNVINDGGTATGSYFVDQIYLCPTSTFNQSVSTWFAQVTHSSSIASKDTSKVDVNVSVPKTLNGKYYVFILTDFYNHINEVSNEGNNTSTGDTMYIFSPDLIVTRILINPTDSTGSPTPIKWTVKNDGKGGDYQGLRYDSIFISHKSTWSRSNSIGIGRYGYSNNILAGDTLQNTTMVTIPDGYNGTKYFYVYADKTNSIYEWTKENNNVSRSADSMNVILSPYPDLLPTILDRPDSAEAGQLVGLIYKVKNQGTNIANPNWKDRFYLTKDSIWKNSSRLLLTSVTKSSILKVDSTYTSAVYFTIPSSVTQGKYYYWVFADALKEVYEHTNDSNNIVRSDKIFIDGYPPVDLKVSCPVINKDTLKSGSSYTLNYTVTNIGEAKTQSASWDDALYLSTDSILNPSDTKLLNIAHNKILEADSSYSVNTSFVIPNGVSGKYYLIIKTDIAKVIYDIDTSNNKSSVCKNTGGAKVIEIELTPPPDLQITSWKIPATATSGQTMKIVWKVTNNGSGSTKSGSWYESFYLSSDANIDGSDLSFGHILHSGNLNPSASYTDSSVFTIPISYTGNYFVLIKTDNTNAEYEHTNENNNIVSGVTTISKAPPADLIVSYITAPSSALIGDDISVTYKVKNIGSNPATGSLRDNIYLSVDTIQDASDVLLNTEYYSLTLAPGSENTKTKTVTISGVSLGNYYVLARTDIMNNINEISDTNNTGYTPGLLNVDVPILPINVKTFDTLYNSGELYYRIIVADSLLGETMLLTLKGDSIKGNNEMYLRYGDIASSSTFDFKHREPFKGNQEIIVPELDTGTYYLYVKGNTTLNSYQNISLYPRILPFEIRKISPAKGGNTGEVTVLIEGSKFTEETIFMILKDGSDLGSKTADTTGLRFKYSLTTPVNTVFIDPTTSYVTFNLLGKDLGIYDVVAIKELGEIAVLDSGFTVENGGSEDLSISMNRPGNTRANMILYWDIVFGNSGNTDIVNRKVKVVSSGGAPIALSPSDLSTNLTELEINIQGNEGPPGRLGPKMTGSVRIYTKSSAALGITIIK